MTARSSRMILGLALEGVASAGNCGGVEAYISAALLAEASDIDFVTLADSFTPTAGLASTRATPGFPGLDALLTLTSLAPRTTRIGLIPTISTTHTEPFHVSKNVASLDWISGGRAGWRPAVATGLDEYALFGRREPMTRDVLWQEASEVLDVSARLWDSWEDDAIIRDIPGGRYVDREKLHYVDFEGAFFRIRGPSITPRPPQGHPVVLIDATEDITTAVAARWADVAVINATDADSARRAMVALNQHSTAAEGPGRHPRVLVNLELGSEVSSAGLADLLLGWHRTAGIDGFVIHLRQPEDLRPFLDEVVPRLGRDQLRAPLTLRERLGLARPLNRYAEGLV